MTWQSLRLLRSARNDILWPPVTEALQTGISIPCRRESIFWIHVFIGIIQRGLHRCRSCESLYGRLALDLAVLVGTGLPAVRGMHGQSTGRERLSQNSESRRNRATLLVPRLRLGMHDLEAPPPL